MILWHLRTLVTMFLALSHISSNALCRSPYRIRSLLAAHTGPVFIGKATNRFATRKFTFHSDQTVGTEATKPYAIVADYNLCGAKCIALHCPEPKEFTFTKDNIVSACGGFGVQQRDTIHIRKELEFGVAKEHGKDSRVNIFMGGRLALRRVIYDAYINAGSALSSVDLQSKERVDLPECGPILSNELGAPSTPPGITGSISHKDRLAIAAALRADIVSGPTGHIGVDIERCTNAAHDKLRRRLFTQTEQDSIIAGKGPAASMEADVMLRFSFKEAIYKALNPYLKRYVEFTEVEVEPQANGTAELKFHLRTQENFQYRAEWRLFDDRYWITCVHIWG